MGDLLVTNWSKLPVYELDFGVGPPINAWRARYDEAGVIAILPTAKGQLRITGFFSESQARIVDSIDLFKPALRLAPRDQQREYGVSGPFSLRSVGSHNSCSFPY